MAMGSAYEETSISCGSLAVGSIGYALLERVQSCAIASLGAGADVGCMDWVPIAVDKLRYHSSNAMHQIDLVG